MNISFEVIARLFVGTAMLFASTVVLRADGPTEEAERLAAPLRNAGVQLDDASLIKALHHADVFVATRAAQLLGHKPRSAEILGALTEAAKHERDEVVLACMYSMNRLGDTSWISIGNERLATIKDRSVQIRLAGLLAESDDIKGWSVVLDGLKEPAYCSLALENMRVFDGKKIDSKTINVVEELEKISPSLPDQSRSKVQKEILAIKAQKETRP